MPLQSPLLTSLKNSETRALSNMLTWQRSVWPALFVTCASALKEETSHSPPSTRKTRFRRVARPGSLSVTMSPIADTKATMAPSKNRALETLVPTPTEAMLLSGNWNCAEENIPVR